MGEASSFTARMERSGALTYFGHANVDRKGEHLGSVGELHFDMLATVIETSGFLEIADTDDGLSTAGETEIDLETTNGPRTISRDAFAVCPIFWAIETLCLSLLRNASWGANAYLTAITDPKDLPEPIHVIEADLNHDRRVLPESPAKRHLRKHRIQPPEIRGADRWIAYRFDDDTCIEYDRSTRTYTICTRGYRSDPRDMQGVTRFFADQDGG
ncbi:hypothetical protein Poly51_49090 [Rubripirellula tenax]|uniref:Uncharacterized protein n=2 Tax=Rubripirellula tenax TaxID=2528015 RepID=A0A5C6EKJ2_9BACT|nr:hypothetical protein Poly51_49090 [Rubripirellula tenax]